MFPIFSLVFLAKPVGIRCILSGEVRALYGEAGATFPRSGRDILHLGQHATFRSHDTTKETGKQHLIDQIKVKEATNHLTI